MRTHGWIALKFGIRIKEHIIHSRWKFIFNQLTNKWKNIANKNITAKVKVTKSRNGGCPLKLPLKYRQNMPSKTRATLNNNTNNAL